MTREDVSPKRHSPITFLTVAVCLTTAVSILLGWCVWRVCLDTRTTAQQPVKAAELRGIIIHLDEVLTMSARMAAGRELRMVELKREVNDMAEKAGLPLPYALGFAESATGDHDNA